MTSYVPRHFFLMILALSLLSGCALTKSRPAPEESWQSYNGMTGISEEAMSSLADHTAQKVADRYPSGRTTLGLYYMPKDEFGSMFETALRFKGFSIDSSTGADPDVLQTAYVMDSIRTEGTEEQTGYLRLKFSDGYSIGHIYSYDPYTGFTEKGIATSTEAFFAFIGSKSATIETGDKEDDDLWIIKPGSLKGQLAEWTNRAGYQLVWKAGHDFEMQADASFKDNFYGAVKRLFTRMNRGGNSLRVTLYQKNLVLEVRED